MWVDRASALEGTHGFLVIEPIHQIQPLIETAVRQGGHVRVGLEDAPMGCTAGNLALAQDAGRRITEAGGRLATASEVRASLKRH